MTESDHDLNDQIDSLIVRGDAVEMHRVVYGWIPRYHSANLQQTSWDQNLTDTFDNCWILWTDLIFKTTNLRNTVVTYVFLGIFHKWQSVEFCPMFLRKDRVDTRCLHSLLNVRRTHIIRCKKKGKLYDLDNVWKNVFETNSKCASHFATSKSLKKARGRTIQVKENDWYMLFHSRRWRPVSGSPGNTSPSSGYQNSVAFLC